MKNFCIWEILSFEGCAVSLIVMESVLGIGMVGVMGNLGCLVWWVWWVLWI